MHSAHHLEPPPANLATHALLLGEQYSTPSTMHDTECHVRNLLFSLPFFLSILIVIHPFHSFSSAEQYYQCIFLKDNLAPNSA